MVDDTIKFGLIQSELQPVAPKWLLNWIKLMICHDPQYNWLLVILEIRNFAIFLTLDNARQVKGGMCNDNVWRGRHSLLQDEFPFHNRRRRVVYIDIWGVVLILPDSRKCWKIQSTVAALSTEFELMVKTLL